ncbi:hypothetical protein MYSTI_06601 [Myxococcus stipitatus DSM 14675]|uniref:Uncharacterized protein n=1 Tax=Myxococcus stipitatus (strain DSM 14675 / JCM 12634 / Mx s8) TaxID=1278073 RepID=L7UN35_MYXSD|nr:hypothetical protein MYSTI_06601 [Myxococcus stipitatus DSM 14675]
MEKPPRERPKAWSTGSCGPLLASSGGCARSTHHRGVDEEDAHVQLVLFLQMGLERSHQPLPGAISTPAHEAVIDGLPGAIARRDVAPGRSGMQPPENPVEDEPVVLPCTTPTLVRQQRGQGPPLSLVQFVAHHAGLPPYGGQQPASALPSDRA